MLFSERGSARTAFTAQTADNRFWFSSQTIVFGLAFASVCPPPPTHTHVG